MAARRSLIAGTVLSLLLGGAGITAARADAGDALYVDNAAAGCDDGGPGSQAKPFCRIQSAADAAGPGTTVHVVATAEPYASVRIASVGTADRPVAFVGEGGSEDGVLVRGTGTSGMDFSGAQYVTVSGFHPVGLDASAITVTDSHHIEFGSGSVRAAFSGGGTPVAVITVDGTSSGISFTRLHVNQVLGQAFTSAAGARDITLADDTFEATTTGSGVWADGTDGFRMAGNTIAASCGNAVSLTGGTSGSVENTVVIDPVPSMKCADTDPGQIVVDARSAVGVAADYNAVNPAARGGHDYSWAGTSYATSDAFHTATGQGAHDLDQTDVQLTSAPVAERSPLIDSGDAAAPGALATDRLGRARVDDPLVPDTGTGHYDRGATEFQDPVSVGLSTNLHPYQGKPTTFEATVFNPWSISGLTYTFDFGDGVSEASSTGTVTHTYSELGSFQARVTAARADGTTVPSTRGVAAIEVQPIAPLSEVVDCSVQPSSPFATWCDFVNRTSYYPTTGGRVTFGDGSAAVVDHGETEFGLAHTYASPGAYTVTRTITDSAGRTATGTATVIVGSSYLANDPVRILDTREGFGAPKKKIGPGGVVRVKVVGAYGAPADGVTAVTMNVTDVNATSSSVVTVYPDGTARPTASNLNFLAGQINPNLVTVPVGKDGYVDFHNASGSVDLVVDLQGFYYTKTPTGREDAMVGTAPVAPVRILDTRNGTGAAQGAVKPGSLTVVNIPGASGQATDGAVVHLTVTGGTGNGVVSVFCRSDSPPSVSNLNYRAGQTTSNLTVPCVETGRFAVYNSGASVHLIADLQALYTDDNAGNTTVDIHSPRGRPFIPTAPTRFLDTRSGKGAPAKPLGVDGTVAVKVAGVAGVPVGASAVLVNLTGTGPTASTVLIAYGGGSLPSVSNLNLVAGETRPALTMIPVDADGYIRIHNHAGTVNVVADLEGYFG